MKRACFLLVCLMLLSFSPALAEKTEASSLRRALLIGCDYFVSMPPISPACENNLRKLSDALEKDIRGYESIVTAGNILCSEETLSDSIRAALDGADDDDVSFIYIGTHGSCDENGRYFFLLSDGTEEEWIEGAFLLRELERIPGKKILALDTCHAGALIGKGMNDPATPLFSQESITVLCSSGGSEISYFNRDKTEGGFFCTELCRGISARDGHPADMNRDGSVTAHEMYVYLYDTYGVSTVQIYPSEDSDTVLFAFDPLAAAASDPLMSCLTFEDTVLSGRYDDAVFSFTLNRECDVYYQLVYYQQGQWQYDTAQLVRDTEEDGPLSPGYKQRSLQLSDPESDSSGYVLMHLITSGEDGPELQGSRLYTVLSPEGDLALSLETGDRFCPAKGEEINIILRHSDACRITVRIKDAGGHIIRYLCYSVSSRPQGLSPDGTCFSWNGRLGDGSPAPAGLYTAEAQVRAGAQVQCVESLPFRLEDCPESGD